MFGKYTYRIFIFHLIFMLFFFLALRAYVNRFPLCLTVQDKLNQKEPWRCKNGCFCYLYTVPRELIFHLILMVFFLMKSSRKCLSQQCKLAICTSYHFDIKRAQHSIVSCRLLCLHLSLIYTCSTFPCCIMLCSV